MFETFPVQPFERLLAVWSDQCFMTRSAEQMLKTLGQQPRLRNDRALASFERFPGFLLGLHAREDDRISLNLVADFLPARRVNGEDEPSLFDYLPLIMAGWQRHSRCLYRLRPELQAVLRETSLRDVQWGDILHDDLLAIRPFKSFALSLPVPIGRQPGRNYNFITVTTVDEGEGGYLCIHAFDQQLEQYEPISKEDLKQITARCQNRKYRTWFFQRYKAEEERATRATIAHAVNLPLSKARQELIADTAARVRVLTPQQGLVEQRDVALERDEADCIIRLVVGFCL